MFVSQFTFTSADIVRDFVQCVTVRYDWTEIHLNVLSFTNFFEFIREHCIVPTFQNIMFYCFCWVAGITRVYDQWRIEDSMKGAKFSLATSTYRLKQRDEKIFFPMAKLFFFLAKGAQLHGLIPTTMFNISSNNKQFPKIKYSISIFHESGQLNMVSNHTCCHLFQMFALNMHQREWFKIQFLKKFLRKSSPGPSPDLSHRFFSGFALISHTLRALNSWALWALNSGFALNFRLERLVYPPIDSWIRPWFFTTYCSVSMNLNIWTLSPIQCNSCLVYTLCLVILIICLDEVTFWLEQIKKFKRYSGAAMCSILWDMTS